MAERPIFIPLSCREHLVEEVYINFIFNNGFAPIQKKKNIVALHEAAKKRGFNHILEVSTKSEDKIGRRLSAFSLKVHTELGDIFLESAFQGSKVFAKGGPYTDIYTMDSLSAKRDPRIKNSGDLIGFDYFGQKWPLIPKTAFYDWLYLSALSPHKDYLKRLFIYDGFSDIEFNPKKSINCQARTCALLISLIKLDLLEVTLKSQENFIQVTSSDSYKKLHSIDKKQIGFEF